MGQLFFGSICLSDLIDLAKQKHSAFTRGNNGKVYASVNVWLNDDKDKFGNIMSVQINPTKEMKDIDKRVYIGNLKESDGPKKISDRDINSIDDDFDVPSRSSSSGTPPPNSGSGSDITEPIDGLPF